jgi:hypothetical protein
MQMIAAIAAGALIASNPGLLLAALVFNWHQNQRERLFCSTGGYAWCSVRNEDRF